MNKLKHLILLAAIVVTVVMMAATFVESSKGTPYAASHIYGTAWYVVLWALLGLSSAAYIVRRQLYRRPSVFLVHVAFLVILCGALASWLNSESGTLHLRRGQTATTIAGKEGKMLTLPFPVTLKDFKIVYYPGTTSPMDYVSQITAGGEPLDISMNNIGSCHGYRFTQSGYDDDQQGTTLGVYYDPWGIGITYAGYLLLLLSLVTLLCSRRTRLRQYYHEALGSTAAKVVTLALLLLSPLGTRSEARAAEHSQEQLAINPDVAQRLGRICVLYNSRICPVNTVATHFVTKLCGRPTWQGMSADEVFAGWIFDVPYWETVRMIEIKDKQIQQLLGLNSKWASFSDFWDQYNEYKLQKPLDEAYRKGDKQLQKKLREADEKFNVIRMLYGGELLKMFPVLSKKGGLQWIAPGEKCPFGTLNGKEWIFVRKVMDYTAESVVTKNDQRALLLLDKIYAYQQLRGQGVIPAPWLIQAELIYNKLNTQRWPVMLYLTVALLLTVALPLRLSESKEKALCRLGNVLTAIMLLHITVLLGLRWIVGGHLPLSNGFETMQFLAWSALLLTLLLQRRFAIIRRFGPLLAAFALLVAMITDSNPQLTQLMPVLQSPLLSVHVMVIMFSYALFGLMALTGIEGIVAHNRHDEAQERQLAALSRLLLYPAVSLLAIGIFVGAVWANVSWGRYWSWDSKETWALITLFIYCAPLHADIRWLQKPLHVHLYMLLAFLSVLMTYFGVNYFLAGMHSYA